jgi:energy-coupling factor transport system substrate-specific component
VSEASTDLGEANDAQQPLNDGQRMTHHVLLTGQSTELPGWRSTRFLAGAILALASALGLGAFLYPFFLPSVPGNGMMAHAADAPLLFALLLLLCLAAVFASLTSQQMTSKLIAVLGILTALSAVLRAIPGPAGFNAIFLLPILAGYCYGPAFGFLLGALSLAVSALIGGGVGPWLPYQMFATGWVGLLSGWLPELKQHHGWERIMLAVWGTVLGFIFGAIMNIWFWPFLAGTAQAGQGWQPGMPIWSTLRSYLVFYIATSLWWDLGRAVGNGALLLLFAVPILRVLRRFRDKFRFDIVPEVVVAPDAWHGS